MAQINPQKLVMSVLIVGLILVIGIYIFAAMNTSLDTPNVLVSVVNASTGTPVTAGYLLTAGANAKDGVCGPVTKIYNDSAGNVQIGLGNITQVGCRVYNATGTWVTQFGDLDTRMTYTYTYSKESGASNASNDMVDALGTGTPWLTIIVVVGFSVIVLALLTEGLGKAAKGNEASQVY